MDDRALEFYKAALHALGEHAHKGRSATGALTVLKRVAIEFGLEVERLPLPRPTRAERQEASWAAR